MAPTGGHKHAGQAGHPEGTALAAVQGLGYQNLVRRRVILTSNHGFSHWGQVFAAPVVATAIVDRPLQSATILNIRGRDFRMRAHEEPMQGLVVRVP